ncbi:T9SS type A sorting domain-containing protein [Microvirga sp. STS02]|uniref:GDSL-type esterase/lipase family protein n=1 Tax=Hymenobacter negativus TaxID=2795026 RepID=UPI0018DB5EA9|nr:MULTISPECIES: GDSL-type esterase/lipase family protein [Bacteria]MBH8567333.1 T9SS type A sorting domain-containing protein [Hymenobacter negativus]MBR7207065.1 T9SS type A sorting domain-containing protein [Microvirga sp. STS02]
MKKPLILLALSALALDSAQAQTTVPVRSLYADFGPNDVTNGNITPSPDANGNYWNNILNNTGVADTFRLVDKANAATGIKLKVGPNFLTNGIATGGLLAPSAALLGQYAIATATQDYFFVQGTGSTATGTLRISGLDPTKRYVFHVFGSRNATAETRVSQYRFTGATTSTITQTTTGPNVGANGYAGNNNTITDSDTLSADGSGVITMELSKTVGSYAYLNLMRIDIVPGRGTVPVVNYAFQNPGFELGNLNFWTTVARGTGAAATVNTATKHAGTYAAQLTGGSLGLEQQISYRATTGVNAYKLSGYFYNPSTGALSGSQSAHLELLYYSSTQALLGRFKSDSLVAASPTNTWTRLEAVGTIPTGTAFVKAAAVWRNAAGTATGAVYFDDLLLQAYYPQNPNKIAFIGSSVLTGVGSTNSNRGYTTLYSELLTRRATAGTGGPWVTTNLGVPGNNTIDVLGRFDNDVLPTASKYVLVGLVLGNEGIITGGQPIFDQFRTNMQRIISLARTDGLTPVVALGYGRNDYAATQYTFVRQMNLLLHGWNVPSVNLLGGVDDGNGRYATGYWWDALHPNDLGHTELMYTLVPSLFDALGANKPLPRRKVSNGITLTKTNGVATNIIRMVPEEIVHPFTQAIRFKTGGAGRLVEIRDSAGIAAGTISVSSGGVVTYQSAKGRSIVGSVPVTNNRWHKLVLTHYYARGATMLYVDSVSEGTVQERLRPTRFDLGGSAAPTRVQFRDWMFFRAGMNQDEILALAADSLLKGSLEIYAPLDGRRVATTDSLANLAQSTNTLARISGPLAVRESAFAAQFSLYPNPTAGLVTIAGPVALEGTPAVVYDALGKAVLTTRLTSGRLNLSALAPGVYSLVLNTREGLVHKRVVREQE